MIASSLLRSKKLLYILGAIAPIVALVSYPAVRLFGKHRPRFVYATHTLTNDDFSQLSKRPGWAAVSTVVSEGISLNGLVRRPATANAPWVLYFPGNDPTQLAQGQQFLERLRQERDWGLFLSSYRGYDSSGGTPSREALAADALRIFDSFIQREHVFPIQIHVVAFSLGGYLAAHLVGQAGHPGRNVASLTLLASVQSIEMVRPSRFQRFAFGDIYDISSLLNSIDTRTLVVTGSADEALGVDQARAIATQLGNRAHYIQLSGVGHESLLSSEPALTAVRDWIESASRPK